MKASNKKIYSKSYCGIFFNIYIYIYLSNERTWMNSNKLEMVKCESLRINVLWTTTRKSVNFPVTHLSKAKKVKDYLICEPFIFFNYICMRKTDLSLFIISDGFLEKTLRFLDLLSSIGVGGSRSVLERTLYTTFYTMIIFEHENSQLLMPRI